jgi:hypothetical protein
MGDEADAAGVALVRAVVETVLLGVLLGIRDKLRHGLTLLMSGNRDRGA